MAYPTALTAREAETIRILKILTQHLNKSVVVGGYAVNALTSQRFSVDCDLVTDKKDFAFFDRILKNEGYKRRQRTRQFRGIHGGTTREYYTLIGGRRVSVDLFVKAVICRQTNGRWSYQFVKDNSQESNVIGLTDAVRALVPKRELLIAMKIHSGRAADLRDVIMLSEGADWAAVTEFMKVGVKEKVRRQMISAIEAMGVKEFPSSLRAEFGLRSDVTALIKRTVAGLNFLNKSLY